MWKRAACLVIALAACTASSDDRTTPTAAPPSSSNQPRGDWRARIAADASELRSSAPAHYAELRGAAPQTTRAHTLRFTTELIRDPRAASVFLERLAEGSDSAEVRAALVEALPRTGGIYADAVAELIVNERDAAVRTAYVFTMRRAPADLAIAVLARGLADDDTSVRAESARSAAAHTDGARLAGELRAALSASDPQLRVEAARALGILRVTGAQPELSVRLSDASADVRLEALRALDRIAPGSLTGRPALEALASDPDPRVARLAASLAGRATTTTP
ncbi:MAG TPA: HEAT repeat domain-containing protein [Kofleriaceae bacterium]|jgi:hypothetical protein|nr:HEAT repeat domain-containing protein [Kofleriaceae bacterium]